MVLCSERAGQIQRTCVLLSHHAANDGDCRTPLPGCLRRVDLGRPTLTFATMLSLDGTPAVAYAPALAIQLVEMMHLDIGRKTWK